MANQTEEGVSAPAEAPRDQAAKDVAAGCSPDKGPRDTDVTQDVSRSEDAHGNEQEAADAPQGAEEQKRADTAKSESVAGRADSIELPTSRGGQQRRRNR